MLNIEHGEFYTSSLSWINQNWIKSTILSITYFWGGFKEWNLEKFQRINWIILSIGSEYSKNWIIVEIEEVSGSIIRFYVMVGWWWWFNVKFYYLSYILGWKEGERMESWTPLDIGGLYLPLGCLSLPLHLEVITSLEQ